MTEPPLPIRGAALHRCLCVLVSTVGDREFFDWCSFRAGPDSPFCEHCIDRHKHQMESHQWSRVTVRADVKSSD